MPDLTNKLVTPSTSPFVVTADKILCSVLAMGDRRSYQDFMDACIKAAGGQTQLARKVSKLLPRGQTLKPQTIQYLQNRKRAKPARGSRHTHLFAQVTGVEPPNSPMDGVREIGGMSYRDSPQTISALERAQEIEGVEFTKDALQVAKAYMDLPRNDRDDFKRKIETAALKHTSRVSDDEYLASTKKSKAPKPPGAKERAKGTH